MSTKYTCKKVPGMGVTLARDGVYIELGGDMMKVSANRPSNIEQAVLEQFQMMDDNIIWGDIDSSELHDQYNNS